MTQFKADAMPLLIGSLPMKDHGDATRLILEYTPEIPLWAQLPMYKEEGMAYQFLPGMPGFTESAEGKLFIDETGDGFDAACLDFYEEFLAVTESGVSLDTSRFSLTPETGRGFWEFLRQVDLDTGRFKALKGQLTGPFTFTTSVPDRGGKAIFYNEQLRDAAVKHLAMNAKWQARTFKARGLTPIIFLDEPALAGFGTSGYITVSRQEVTDALNEVMAAVHEEGGLAGIHVCANTEWDMLLESDIDIINFDAYAFFDKFILYPDKIRTFVARGGIIAWGIVPTANVEDINRETCDTLARRLEAQMARMEALGIDRATLISQSFITPSCGTGSIDLDAARRVLRLTRELSSRIRS